MKIFETYVESYPAVRDQRVVDLCLVNRYWNVVANGTPQLWTRIKISFPFAGHHLAAVHKRVRASKLRKVDVSIDFRDLGWDGSEPHYNQNEAVYRTRESIWVQDIMALLGGTEKRWKSIRVVSQTWLPFYKLMESWTFAHLPSLESISMWRENPTFGMQNIPFDPQLLIGPMTLFERNASLPNLRNLSLSGVHVNWDDASFCYQNLRRLEINNITYDVGPSFEQFAAMLSSSPRLECLDVSGFCPEHHTEPGPAGGGDPDIPVVHLPALKEFTFGWKDADNSYDFLQMFQIGNSLEKLTLVDTESGLGYWEDPRTQSRHWTQNSEEIFEGLYELVTAAPRAGNDMPPGPFIAMGGVKKLRIAWTKAAGSSLVPLLTTLTELEEIWLEDVDRDVLEDVMVGVGGGMARPSLRIDLRWTWRREVPDFAGPIILYLENRGIEVTAKAGEDLQAWGGWS